VDKLFPELWHVDSPFSLLFGLPPNHKAHPTRAQQRYAVGIEKGSTHGLRYFLAPSDSGAGCPRGSHARLSLIAKIVMAAVQSYPLECTDAEQMLLGQKLSPDLIAAVAQAAYKPAKPLDNTDMAHGYRKKMARIYVERALTTLTIQS